MIGGIEAGGTKCVLAVGETPDSIAATHTIPTRNPDETVAEALAWFATQPSLTALGLATFGPVGLDRERADYGHILATPKPGWSGFDLAGALADGLHVPVTVDTGAGRWFGPVAGLYDRGHRDRRRPRHRWPLRPWRRAS